MFIHWLDYGSDGTFTISLLEALLYESFSCSRCWYAWMWTNLKIKLCCSLLQYGIWSLRETRYMPSATEDAECFPLGTRPIASLAECIRKTLREVTTLSDKPLSPSASHKTLRVSYSSSFIGLIINIYLCFTSVWAYTCLLSISQGHSAKFDFFTSQLPSNFSFILIQY
jgi:hypothetical protein